MGDALIKDDYRRKFKENKYIVAYRTYKTRESDWASNPIKILLNDITKLLREINTKTNFLKASLHNKFRLINSFVNISRE